MKLIHTPLDESSPDRASCTPLEWSQIVLLGYFWEQKEARVFLQRGRVLNGYDFL